LTRIAATIVVVGSLFIGTWFIYLERPSLIRQEEFNKLRRNMASGLVVIDGDSPYIVLDVSPRFTEMYGWTFEQCTGYGISFLLNGKSMETHKRYLNDPDLKQQLLRRVLRVQGPVRCSDSHGGGYIESDIEVQGIEVDRDYRWVITVTPEELINEPPAPDDSEPVDGIPPD
jgi:PAS domain-containing protein